MRKRARTTRRTPARGVKRSMVRGSTVVHRFIRRSAPFVFTGVTGTTLLGANQIRFNTVLNSSEFTTLYDQYRIDRVKFTFYLRLDPAAQVAANSTYPKLYWARDLDDDTAPTVLNTLRERANCKTRVLTPTRPVVIWVKPNIVTELYRTAGSTGYSPKFAQWIDMASSDLLHFGLKYAIDLLPTGCFVDLEQEFHFSCKNPQ